MNEEEKEAYYFFKEQRAMYNKWVADKTASESDVVLARYYNLLFEILDKQQEVIDMIASDYIQDYLYDERSDYPCEFYYDEIKKKDSCKQGKIGVCKECLKEYYFNKVKENENEQM